MAKFSPLDILYVTIDQNGSFFKSEYSGVSSWKELLALLRPGLTGMSGLLTVNVRNASAGWSARQSLLVR